MNPPGDHPGLGEIALVIEEDRGAVGRARRFISDQLGRHGLAELVDDAQLIATELVTNALLHVGPPAEVVLRLAPPTARLEVRDQSPVPPVRQLLNSDAMTGRGLHLVETLARRWGVIAAASGKSVWAELDAGAVIEEPDLDVDTLIDMWTPEEPQVPVPSRGNRYTVRLGDVPTDLLLSAKSHVDNLVREFTLAASGAHTGATARVPAHIASMTESVVHRFAEARQSIKRQALVAANAGEDHVRLELTLPASAADAGEEYLRGLDQADEYCRAARLLTLESSPQHRIFRRWYVEELIRQLRRAAAAEPPVPAQTFEERLLQEIDRIAAAEHRSERAARLHSLAAALVASDTPEAVTNTVLREGVAALGAAGGGVLLAAGETTLAVAGTVGYDENVVAGLRAESLHADLPAAAALRSGKAVWLESLAERDSRFPDLAELEPATVSMCAVPLEVGGRRLGGLRFSFHEPRLFGVEERRFIEAMGAHAAQALDRALQSRQSLKGEDDANRLQRSLLPTFPPIPGIKLSAAYRPLRQSIALGGDFLDVWECGPARWAVALGDVSGSGPEAAAVGVLVRHTLRALTLSSTDVEFILSQLNQALLNTFDDPMSERFCTVLFGFLTIESSETVLELASGGHPGPISIDADGAAVVTELTGSLVGMAPDPVIDRRALPLRPGDEILLVTDGTTEARNSEGAPFGTERIVAATKLARAAGADTAEAIREAVLAHSGGRLRDDLAMLAIRREGSNVARRRAPTPTTGQGR